MECPDILDYVHFVDRDMDRVPTSELCYTLNLGESFCRKSLFYLDEVISSFLFFNVLGSLQNLYRPGAIKSRLPYFFDLQPFD